MTDAKEIIFEEEAREKLGVGISKLAEAVRATLGPKGRSVGLEKGYGAPSITNDGNSIVDSIELADQFENMGVAMAKQVSGKLKEKCGDGTTTGILLLDTLVQKGIKAIAAGISPISIKRGMEKSLKVIIDSLEQGAIKIKDKCDILNIATVSASGKEEVGQMIADAIEKVGNEGVVTIEEAKGTETMIEMVEGMQFDRGYISPYFCTDGQKMTVEMEQPYVLLVDKKISSIQELLPILQMVATSGKSLLLIAEDIEADALATLVVNKMRGTLRIAAVKAPGFGDRRKALLEDLAILTGATLISEEAGLYLKEAKVEMLGTCERVQINKDTTTIIGGVANEETLKSRITQIETEIAQATNTYDKEKLQERKAKLKGGIAVIRVGAMTESELKQKKQIFEDSLSSTQAALEEGVVVGGGIALLQAAKKIASLNLEGDEAVGGRLIEKACQAPTRQIISNAGKDGSVLLAEIQEQGGTFGFNAKSEQVEDLLKAGVIDPAKVVKNSLLYAVSVAGVILISEVLIGDAEDDENEVA